MPFAPRPLPQSNTTLRSVSLASVSLTPVPGEPQSVAERPLPSTPVSTSFPDPRPPLPQSNTTLRSVSLSSVSLTPVPGEPLDLDPLHPNGSYALDLADPAHRQVCVRGVY